MKCLHRNMSIWLLVEIFMLNWKLRIMLLLHLLRLHFNYFGYYGRHAICRCGFKIVLIYLALKTILCRSLHESKRTNEMDTS